MKLSSELWGFRKRERERERERSPLYRNLFFGGRGDGEIGAYRIRTVGMVTLRWKLRV